MLDNEFISAVTKSENRKAQQQKLDAKARDEQEQWKNVINRLEINKDFQHFLTGMVQFSGLFTDDITPTDAVKGLVDRGRKQFYLKLVRPYLEKATRNAVEP